MKTPPHSGQCPTSPVLHIPTYLAETRPSARVTDSRLGPMSAAVAGQALREAVEAGSTPVTLPPCDPGLASVLKERKQKSSSSLYTQFQSRPALPQSSCMSEASSGSSLVVEWLKCHLPMQGTRVQSPVGELRSHMPRSN